jgi:hypothetical protein
MVAAVVTLSLTVSCSSNEKSASHPNSNPVPAGKPTSDSSIALHIKDSVIEVPYQMSEIPFDLNGKPVTLAGATFTPASQWTDHGAAGKLKARYSYGPLPPDTVEATAVAYLPERAMSVQEAREAWIRRISFPDGRDPRRAALVHSRQVGGMTAHVLSIMGDYTPPGAGNRVAISNARFVGIVLETGQGQVHFELVGPDYTARIMIEAFMTMIYNVRKAG